MWAKIFGGNNIDLELILDSKIQIIFVQFLIFIFQNNN